jgi:hypothetical protein
MKRASLGVIVATVIAVNPAAAQDQLEFQRRILFVIAETVGRICYTVEQQGREAGIALSLETGSQLRDGLTKLAELDVRSAGRYTSTQYQGVLQYELAATLRQTQDCKQAVFDKLIERMMPIGAIASLSPSRGGDRSDVVRNFYVALGRADGVTASSLVIPEKRSSGPFSAGEITEFYSSLSEPLRLLGLTSMGGDNYQATYTYRAGRHACAGSATVTLVQRGDRTYIERIKALQGC